MFTYLQLFAFQSIKYYIHDRHFHFLMLFICIISQGIESGNALGVHISSLDTLMNTKSTPPVQTLLHYIVKTAEQKDPDALAFVGKLLKPLQKASRWPVFEILSPFIFSKYIDGSIHIVDKNTLIRSDCHMIYVY